MGLGDEILALGEAEEFFEMHRKPVSIVSSLGYPREHEAWFGNPAWDKKSPYKLMNGGGARPYILSFNNQKIEFNYEYKPRAGRVYLTDEEIDFCKIQGDFAVIAPNLKSTASPNKCYPFDYWQKIADNSKMPLIQLYQEGEKILNNVKPIKTVHFKQALSYIKKAKFVMCSDGGSHHMAASMRTMAFVVFGSFSPPEVLGYNFHCNFTVEDAHYCGDWKLCSFCQESLKKIYPEIIINKINLYLRGEYVSGICRI